jgi:hypothetical protein
MWVDVGESGKKIGSENEIEPKFIPETASR